MKKILYAGLLASLLFLLTACGDKKLEDVLTGTWDYDMELKGDKGTSDLSGNFTFYSNGEVDVAPSDDDSYYTGEYKIADNVVTIEYTKGYSGIDMTLTQNLKIDLDDVTENELSGTALRNQFIGEASQGADEGTIKMNKEK